MLLTIALLSLLVLAVLGIFGTLLDAAIRAANAYPSLKLAMHSDGNRLARVRKIETFGMGSLPASRLARTARPVAFGHTGRSRNHRQSVSAAA